MRFILTSLLIVLLFSGCRSGGDGASNASSTAKRYVLRGKVVSVDPVAKKATIDHEAIEGYMDAMTMAFPIHADWVWEDLKPGSEIRADLVVDNTAKEPYWLENIGIIANAKPGQAEPPVNEQFAQVGQQAPDFVLTDQDGKRITMKDYRGKALAITFIYAKCPLPDYCIRMSQNFSDLAKEVAADDQLRDHVRLLSISFDPANDTPEKLRQYGLGYLGPGAKLDFTVWQLAVGKDEEVRRIADYYNLRYEVDPNNKAQFSHSLRTIVITPEGKVSRIYAGNEWTPAELLRELKTTLDNPK